LNDDAAMLSLLKNAWEGADGSEASIKELVTNVLGYEKNWKTNLNHVEGLNEAVTSHLIQIEKYGIADAIKQIKAKAAFA
jgi:tagaturonate reductase